MGEEEIKPKMTEKAEHDYVLVKAALENGDQKAYAELMDRYRDSLYFMMLRMIGHADDADDLTIEAFGKAFSRLHQYQHTFAFSTWLFKIASNNCIDFMRKKKMQTFSLDKTISDSEGKEYSIDVASTNLTPDEDLEKKQKIQKMREVVDKLKPHYKQLIEMRYFQELSIEEIMDKLNLPEGTIKAQLFRAREFLANILQNSEHKL